MNAKDIIISNFTIDNPQKFKLLLLLFFCYFENKLAFTLHKSHRNSTNFKENFLTRALKINNSKEIQLTKKKEEKKVITNQKKNIL